MPIAIEEAAMIDGCNPIQIFFKVVCPILKPTMISTAILETMWVWNDYLLPTLVLDIKTYRTIPMAIQYFRGSYGKVDGSLQKVEMTLTNLTSGVEQQGTKTELLSVSEHLSIRL